MWQSCVGSQLVCVAHGLAHGIQKGKKTNLQQKTNTSAHYVFTFYYGTTSATWPVKSTGRPMEVAGRPV